MSLREAANAVVAALVAPPCAACGRVLDRPLDGAVCPGCWDAVVRHAPPFGLPSISRAEALGPYAGALRTILHALKYDGRRSIAPRLSRMMAGAAGNLLSGANLVVPVPLHRRKLRERGFNQANDLARGLGLPVRHLLVRVRATRPQVDLAADERRRNVDGAFAMRSRLALVAGWAVRRVNADSTVRGRVIVLIDDVATTGATLEACARVLREAGAAEVRALTAARAVIGLPGAPRA